MQVQEQVGLNQRNIYSPYKAAHHLDKLKALRLSEIITPTQVQVDLTNACNHNCVYCFYRCAQDKKLNAEFNPKDNLSKEVIWTLLYDLKKMKIPAVQYTGGGEPMCHPHFEEILERTIENRLEYSLVTNGTLIRKKHLPLLKKAAWIRISLDAATSATYAKTQSAPSEHFDVVVNNIRMLAEECPFTIIGVSFVVNPINWMEIKAATELAKYLGARNIRISAAYTPKAHSLFKEHWEEIDALSLRAKKLEDVNFKVFDLATDHIDNLALRTKGYSKCYYQHFTAVVGADGGVYPCCTLKYNSIAPLGTLHYKTFRDIWYGEERFNWVRGDHMKTCNDWPCWMDSKNRFIEYLVDNHAQHVNFI